jgi:PKD repeat protein
MVFRLSTLSSVETDGVDYETGDLSLFPEVLDDKKSLYTVANNAETVLKQSVSYNGKYIIVEDAGKFPPYGLLRLSKKMDAANYEIVYYDKRNDTTFMDLVRGFAGSTQNSWVAAETIVANSVMAETHNAVKDALLRIQEKMGVKEFPSDTSLNGILKALESQHLAPKPLFRGFPLKGPPPLTVRFQNFSNSEAIRFLWDFGDGTQSSEKNPTHTYQTEGEYTVQLNMVMSTGAQGASIKNDYVRVSDREIVPFFYATLLSDNNEAPAEYEFVDQTDGDIASRFWVFGDGESEQITNANKHTIRHTYTAAGDYNPSLLIVFRDQTLKRVFLKEGITVE